MTREETEAYILGSAGLIYGTFKEYIQPELTAKRAWIALIGAIAVYDTLCGPGETLSEGADRAIDKNKWLTIGAIGYTSLHLANALPKNLDLFHRLTNRGSNL